MPFIWGVNQAANNEHSFRELVSQPVTQHLEKQNQWFLFRKQFTCTEELTHAITKITVDGRYQLFVNGIRVSRGPIRCDPEFLRYDQIDIARFLKQGTNTLGVLVHVYGKDIAWYQQSKDIRQSIFGDGGLYFDLLLQPKDAIKSTTIVSDDSWKWLKLNAWQQDTPQSGWGQGFIEKFDAKMFPNNWLDNDFDDSHWENAEVLVYQTGENEKKMGWDDIYPFPVLVKNNLEPLSEFEVFPKSILSVFNVKPDPSLDFSERLYQEEFTVLDSSDNSISNIKHILKDNDDSCVIQKNTANDISIVVVFDKLYTGYPFIEIEAMGGEIIEVAVSEKLPGEYTETGISENRIRVGSHLDCRHLFSYTAKAGIQKFEKFEWTAVKYLQIVIRNINTQISIKKIGINATHYPLKNEGDFNCSSDFLNRLWEMGRYTTLLCSHDAWEDCPSREKRQWIGDGLIHYPVAQVCFGNSGVELDKLYLHQAAESQRTDGLLQMFAPGDHHYHGIVIPDFSLHWISTLYQYLWNTNDIDTVVDLFPTVQKILNWFYLQLNHNGMIETLPHWHFIEWADMGRNKQSATINALFAGTLKHAVFMAEEIGFKSAAIKMERYFESIVEQLNNKYFDNEKGVYTDWILDSKDSKTQQVSQHANSLMIYYELAPKKRWQGILNYICEPKRVKRTATPPVVMHADKFNLESDVVQCNTYYSHFLYGALSKADRFKQALDIIQTNYSYMLNTETSTLWESFAPDASLCHAFSASPVYYLSNKILGVKSLQPGFKRVTIEPRLCGLSSANGSYPTVHGCINIEWKIVNNTLQIDLLIPENIEADLKIPRGFEFSQQKLDSLTGSHRFKFNLKKEVSDGIK